jgi:hypothetical protein
MQKELKKAMKADTAAARKEHPGNRELEADVNDFCTKYKAMVAGPCGCDVASLSTWQLSLRCPSVPITCHCDNNTYR